MKNAWRFISFFLLLTVIAGCINNSPEAYLKKVLKNLDAIESATYYATGQSWMPGDSASSKVYPSYIKECFNPEDTTIGSVFVTLDGKDTTRLKFAYDGKVKATTYEEDKDILIDDFSYNQSPFRLITPPFFNYAKSIINYMLTTTDSITLNSKESTDDYYYKLVIHEDRQVEFKGKAEYMPKNSYIIDPISIYELWINKSTGMPYKVRREMYHNISVETCTNIVAFNSFTPADLNIYDYLPQDYEIRNYKPRTITTSPTDLIGKKAPDWTLTNMHEQPVSLSGFKSKLLLIKFTGIGCAPCMEAIPYLKGLKEKYNSKDFDIVAIECWQRPSSSVQHYTEKHELNYVMLCGGDKIQKNYLINVYPTFFLLDQQHIIRYAFTGYNKEATGAEISKAIDELLK